MWPAFGTVAQLGRVDVAQGQVAASASRPVEEQAVRVALPDALVLPGFQKSADLGQPDRDQRIERGPNGAARRVGDLIGMGLQDRLQRPVPARQA